jgi:hypothetical protein
MVVKVKSTQKSESFKLDFVESEWGEVLRRLSKK